MPRRISTIPSSVSGRLSEWVRWAAAHPRLSAAAALVAAFCIVIWRTVDFSDDLAPDQVEIVRAFAERSQAPSVLQTFERVFEDGRLTVNEARTVIEAGKHATPGYGLLSDQKNTE